MSEWDIYLELVDDKSSKFWRARKEGTDLIVNYGRIGTNGQTKTKGFGSEDAVAAEMDKLARSKRRKGYDDAEGGAAAPAEEAAPAPSGPEPKSIALQLSDSDRKAKLRLNADGATVRTVVVEQYRDDNEAEAAFLRIKAALLDEGYKKTADSGEL